MNHDPYSSPQAEPHRPNPTFNSSAATFDMVVTRFRTLIGSGGVLGVWAIVALCGLPSQLLSVTAQEFMLTDIALGFGIFALVYPLALIVMTLHFTSFKAIDAADAAGGDLALGEATGHLFARFLPTLLTTLLYGIAVIFGSFFCLLPGLIAAVLFCMAPYITATQGDTPIDAMRLSYEWVTRHPALIAILICVGIFYGFAVGVLGAGIMLGSGAAMGQMGQSVGYGLTVVTWVISSFAGYFVWLFSGATYVTIARAEEAMMLANLQGRTQDDIYGGSAGSAQDTSTPTPYDDGGAW